MIWINASGHHCHRRHCSLVRKFANGYSFTDRVSWEAETQYCLYARMSPLSKHWYLGKTVCKYNGHAPTCPPQINLQKLGPQSSDSNASLHPRSRPEFLGCNSVVVSTLSNQFELGVSESDGIKNHRPSLNVPLVWKLVDRHGLGSSSDAQLVAKGSARKNLRPHFRL